MFIVEVEKRCGCFTRSKMEHTLEFDTKEKALKKAGEMLEHMNTKFCKKHSFKIVEDGNTIKIAEEEN